jgi:hypothetical protein
MRMLLPNIDANLAIAGATRLGFEKSWRPSRRWSLAIDESDVATQVQQMTAATVVNTSAATLLDNSGNSQGKAQPVKNVRITRRSLNSSQYEISVSFTPLGNDRFFQGVAISLQQGDDTPLQIAFGRVSPITFVVAKSAAASSLAIQSVGSLGDTSIDRSPSRAVPLQP